MLRRIIEWSVGHRLLVLLGVGVDFVLFVFVVEGAFLIVFRDVVEEFARSVQIIVVFIDNRRGGCRSGIYRVRRKLVHVAQMVCARLDDQTIRNQLTCHVVRAHLIAFSRRIEVGVLARGADDQHVALG